MDVEFRRGIYGHADGTLVNSSVAAVEADVDGGCGQPAAKVLAAAATAADSVGSTSPCASGKDDDPVLLEETEDVEDWLELADRDTNNEGRLRKKAKLFVLDNADGTVPARKGARSAMPAPATAVASAAAPPAAASAAAPPAAAAAAAAAAVTGAGSAAAAPAFGPGQGHRIRLFGMLPRGTPLVPGAGLYG